jgi:hypothetical protein
MSSDPKRCAQVLYAAQQFPELQPLIKRKFKQQGDVAAVSGWVLRVSSDAVQRWLLGMVCCWPLLSGSCSCLPNHC